ncbi:CDP-alcohol phosphatidyltransferase [Ferroglobus placidus DSM 10642]|uniref:Bifunctional IPC transferase and DIPP synthase n=1 Tax=Ferroglobus placidus (strain DSM 10642 / AEDII12DO) TaxID=589924 RepID=D3S199_FERPA|nr:bifunctional L-myo-inositol-1-phosphate cytidylyltransferase/CDP-L-myo-inositol myo-inositolphosphotransferase [Ferroglobus placidus]ADC64335.1 CDP-alcohol phosphatidyltransferase [Ferroglobus placidus DSM 10642]
MKAIVLAAGKATRMKGKPKPILKVGGVEMIKRTVNLLKSYVDEFIFVVHMKEVEDFVKKLDVRKKIIRNEYPEKGNGYSFLLALNHVDGEFILTMADHVYSKEFVEKAVKLKGLVVDRNPKYVDVKEATKVKVENGNLVDCGKNLTEFDGVDTGFFILSKKDVSLTDSTSEELSLCEVMKSSRIPVSYLDGLFWMDVDTEEELKVANKLIVKESVKKTGDGFVSRHFNRKVSTWVSSKLVNRIEPMTATILSFFVGVLSALIAFFDPLIGGVVYQISSILDGIDGEIARASMKQSEFGGYIDSIFDRVVDFLFILAIATVSREFFWGMLAAFTTTMVSYSTEKYKAEFKRSPFEEIKILNKIPGKRDERIFATMIFCLFGFLKELLIFLTLLSIFRVAATIYLVKRSESP